jgi:hypothetical protein
VTLSGKARATLRLAASMSERRPVIVVRRVPSSTRRDLNQEAPLLVRVGGLERGRVNIS